MKYTRSQRILLSILSGVLFFLSWYPMPAFPLIFVAWIPLLLVQHDLSIHNEKGFFKYAYLTLLIWNVSVTWWVVNSSFIGGVTAFILNSLLMYLPLAIYVWAKKYLSFTLSLIVFVCAYLSFEKLHLTWEFTWPWLTLGNVFASQTYLIQWYEWTGHLGGSAWVLLVNAFIFYLLVKSSFQSRIFFTVKNGLLLLLIIGAPILTSFLLSENRKDICKKGMETEVVVVQPNIDPFDFKFDNSTVDWQMDNLIHLSNQMVSLKTDFVLWPETSIPTATWLDHFYEPFYIQKVVAYTDSIYPTSLLVGITLLEQYDHAATSTARMVNADAWVDMYNAAILLQKNKSLTYYKKSKLVPGVERMPYPGFFKFLGPLTIDLGGIAGSHGTQDVREPLENTAHKKLAPVICYESVYGEYVTGYIRQGAQAIAIITNDGWWGRTPGYLQHFEYARLRCIETRKWCARSANTGISGFIDPLGNTFQKTEYWKPDVRKQTIYLNDEQTFFVKYGDWIAYLSIIILVGLILISFKNKFYK